MNAYQIKWAIVTPVFSEGFTKAYKSALRKAGFMPIGGEGDVYGNHYNASNPVSVERFQKELKKLNEKISSYKRKRLVLAFTITDKQFGLIGTKKTGWAKYQLPTGAGVIPVTKEQLYGRGAIVLPCSQIASNFSNL